MRFATFGGKPKHRNHSVLLLFHAAVGIVVRPKIFTATRSRDSELSVQKQAEYME